MPMAGSRSIVQRGCGNVGDVARQHPIGVYDSGVGGLTVVHWLREVLPREQMVSSETQLGFLMEVGLQRRLLGSPARSWPFSGSRVSSSS